MSHHEVDFFVQVQLRQRQWRNGAWRTASAVKLTQEKPHQVEPDAVVVKVRLRVPAEAFHALVTPTIDVPVPALSVDGEATR